MELPIIHGHPTCTLALSKVQNEHFTSALAELGAISMQSVGVTNTAQDPESLKRYFLFFDKMAVFGLEQEIGLHRSGIHPCCRPDLADELEWLRDTGMLVDQEALAPPGTLLHLDAIPEWVQSQKHLGELLRTNDQIEKLPWMPIGDGWQGLPYDRVDIQREALEWHRLFKSQNLQSLETEYYLGRMFAAQARNTLRYDAVCVIKSPPSVWLSPEGSPGNQVVQVVLSALPVPDDLTAWEQIAEFRSDPDSKRKLLQLKVWMRELAKGNCSHAEAEEKLEWLMREYEHHMQIHRMKTSQGVLEAVVTTAAEIAEDLVKIRWSNAAKALFSMRMKRIELLEAESKAPGHEIAYLLKAKNAFRRE
jgi:hypothetical protein